MLMCVWMWLQLNCNLIWTKCPLHCIYVLSYIGVIVISHHYSSTAAIKVELRMKHYWDDELFAYKGSRLYMHFFKHSKTIMMWCFLFNMKLKMLPRRGIQVNKDYYLWPFKGISQPPWSSCWYVVGLVEEDPAQRWLPLSVWASTAPHRLPRKWSMQKHV